MGLTIICERDKRGAAQPRLCSRCDAPLHVAADEPFIERFSATLLCRECNRAEAMGDFPVGMHAHAAAIAYLAALPIGPRVDVESDRLQTFLRNRGKVNVSMDAARALLLVVLLQRGLACPNLPAAVARDARRTLASLIDYLADGDNDVAALLHACTPSARL